MCSLCLEFFSRHVWLDEETGHLRRAGNSEIADCKSGNYRALYLFREGKKVGFSAHRVIFLLHNGHWPKNTVDHKDRAKHNNVPTNLRDATMLEQWLNSPRADEFRKRNLWRYG